MEGFESTRPQPKQDHSLGEEREDESDEDIDENTEDGKKKKDFQSAPDTEILAELSENYKRILKTFPSHPKYDKLLELTIPEKNIFTEEIDLRAYKHLVFVRRIPSIRELTARINRAYDAYFIKKILKAWGKAREPYSSFLEAKTGRAQYEKFVKSIRGTKKRNILLLLRQMQKS